jgi:DNA repair exonuclease SbcCD ATPase subunit
MSHELQRAKSPEEQELDRKRAELAARESLLADRELELATLNAELSSFNRRYINRVGARYAELDEIEARIAETKAKNSPHDAYASKVATAARERASETAQAGEALAKSAPRENFKPTDRLKNVYREVAKAVHPDLATDDEERARRHKFMADANAAYEDGDEARLEAILHSWQASPEAVKGYGVGAELVRTIRKLAQIGERLNFIDAAIAAAKDTPIAKLRVRVETAEAKGKDFIAEIAHDLDSRIAAAKQRLRTTRDKGCL